MSRCVVPSLRQQEQTKTHPRLGFSPLPLTIARLRCSRARRAATDLGLRRSLAVEVKALHSDAGRRELVSCIGEYRAACAARLDGGPHAAHKYGRLGWAGIIAFPHLFAASFGEFGGREWRRWAAELNARGIPARCCHFHWLDLARGA